MSEGNPIEGEYMSSFALNGIMTAKAKGIATAAFAVASRPEFARYNVVDIDRHFEEGAEMARSKNKTGITYELAYAMVAGTTERNGELWGALQLLDGQLGCLMYNIKDMGGTQWCSRDLSYRLFTAVGYFRSGGQLYTANVTLAVTPSLSTLTVKLDGVLTAVAYCRSQHLRRFCAEQTREPQPV